jgi:predicted kinase
VDRTIVVIITGSPGAGKTRLGKWLARELELPFIGKDDIKELLFETLGWKDREWSKKLGQASFELLFHFLECHLAVAKSVVVETAFIPEFHNARFSELRGKYDFEPVQIVCTACEEILYKRFADRCTSGERHPGHVDYLATHDQFVEVLRTGRYDALEIEGTLLRVDTTHFEQVDYKDVVETVRALQH